MHSSRMCTVRNSSRLLGGVPGPGGCTCWGVPGPGGTWSQGGVSARGVPAQVLTPPPVNRMTDRCKKNNLRNFVADGKNNYNNVV